MKPEIILDDETGRILHYACWYEDWFVLFTHLKRNVVWESRHLNIFGRNIQIPRLEAWVGEPETRYCYSGKQYVANGWPPILNPIISRLSTEFQWTPNAALLNFYRNGRDSVGYHADNEPELGVNPTVAILSLGAVRTISFKQKNGPNGQIKVPLVAGSLLWMEGEVQENWLHAINKVSNAEERISCTFRLVK